MSKAKIAIIFLILSVFLFLILLGTIMSQVDTPKFKVIKSFSKAEIREYDHTLIAQVEVEGERSVAINVGFKRLADYIFGNNHLNKKMPMTAPVLQQAISHDSKKDQNWQVSFVMPAIYNMNDLPMPNTNIKIKEILNKQYVVIRFSGFSTESNLNKNLIKIKKIIQEENLKTINQPIFSFYNPPWTLPFLRRNEIMFELK